METPAALYFPFPFPMQPNKHTLSHTDSEVHPQTGEGILPTLKLGFFLCLQRADLLAEGHGQSGAIWCV